MLSPSEPSRLQSLGAIAAGWFTAWVAGQLLFKFIQLASGNVFRGGDGRTPEAHWYVIMIVAAMIAMMAGGFVTGRVAGSQRVAHATFLGFVFFLLFAPLVLMPDSPFKGEPWWYLTGMTVAYSVGPPAGATLDKLIRGDA